MVKKIQEYIKKWKLRGYSTGIPDEVPIELSKLQLAPSYKLICMAILNNDHTLKSLGFEGIKTEWYNAYKRIELQARNNTEIYDIQLSLFD